MGMHHVKRPVGGHLADFGAASRRGDQRPLEGAVAELACRVQDSEDGERDEGQARRDAEEMGEQGHFGGGVLPHSVKTAGFDAIPLGGRWIGSATKRKPHSVNPSAPNPKSCRKPSNPRQTLNPVSREDVGKDAGRIGQPLINPKAPSSKEAHEVMTPTG